MRERVQLPPPAAEGERGERGKTGPSAFDVAREAGFRGSVAQWVESLKGAKGEPGTPGKHGEKGAAGRAAMPMLPTSAQFERDPDNKLTTRMLVNFPSGVIEVTPERDDEGFMFMARFAPI